MIYTREQREAIESNSLAPYAVKSRDSRGRQFPEPEDAHRLRFERDRDRVIHTTAFRRLEYKTQVFVNYEGDYYRTRLTHTLEVAQVGRSIAQALGANEPLVEAICLAHDLGHPPFGHSGEDALDRLMADHGGFNHNLQTYRILTELEERYPKWRGLNLCYETLEGVVKHETKHDRSAELGYDPAKRGSLEAQIADLSDELAYNAHDLDDGLCAGILELEQLDELAIWTRVKDLLPKDTLKNARNSGTQRQRGKDQMRIEGVRKLISIGINDAIDASSKRIAHEGTDSAAAIQSASANVAGYSPTIGEEQKELKAFLYENLYFNYRVTRMAFKAGQFIEQLFNAYTARPKQLPPEVYARIEEKGLHRTVTDYIAGMTDRFALQEYEKLFDPFTRA